MKTVEPLYQEYMEPSILKANIVRVLELQPLLGKRGVSLGFSEDLRVVSCFSWFISIQVNIEKSTLSLLI